MVLEKVSLRDVQICFLKKSQEDQDWGIVAMVLDRLFLWLFGTVAALGTLFILSASPYIFDEVDPIDVVYSKIAQAEKEVLDETILS